MLWEWPRRFFFSSYWLTLGAPSLVYVLASGWMGTRLCGSILSDSANTRGGVGSDWVVLGLGGGLVVSGCVLIRITLLRAGSQRQFGYSFSSCRAWR